MDIAMNGQLVKKLREERSWSQEHLAAAAGLSLRTIQRVEAEGKASPETRLSLAAALSVELAQLNAQEQNEPNDRLSSPHGRLSWPQYRLIRLLVVTGILLGIDLYAHQTLTWSRWPVLIMTAFFCLRWFKAHYVTQPDR